MPQLTPMIPGGRPEAFDLGLLQSPDDIMFRMLVDQSGHFHAYPAYSPECLSHRRAILAQESLRELKALILTSGVSS